MVRQRRLGELFGWLCLGAFWAFVQRLSSALISYFCPCSFLLMIGAWHGPEGFCDCERIEPRAQRMAVGPRPATGLRQLHIEAPHRNTGGHLARCRPTGLRCS